MSRTHVALRQVLLDLGIIQESDVVTFHRNYAGWWQRAAGAWSWYCVRDSFDICGSQWPMKTIIEYHKAEDGRHVSQLTEWGNISLFPEKPIKRGRP